MNGVKKVSVIEVYLGEDHDGLEISKESYTDKCLNPDCETKMATIGVCVGCANSDYNPLRHGVEA